MVTVHAGEGHAQTSASIFPGAVAGIGDPDTATVTGQSTYGDSQTKAVMP